jgi:hypothetical protein
MRKQKYILLVALTIGFVTISMAQHTRYAIRNGVGLQGGITQFDILTDNFETTKGSGWLAGLNATVAIPHKWYTVSYNMLLSQNTLEISGRTSNDAVQLEALEYKLLAVKAGVNFHIKLIEDYLMLELGPLLQYNSKLELEDEVQEDYFVNGYDTVMAKDIEDISKFNVNGMLGVSAGIGRIKLRAQYIYGFTNMFKKLNEADFTKGLNTTFKGHQSLLAFSAMLTF